MPSGVPDLPTALRELLARVAPYDPDPASPPVVTVRLTAAGSDETVPLSRYATEALCTALWNYQDPRDCGPCDHCGRRGLDEHLRCPHCGTVNGIFGETLARHALKVRRDGGPEAERLDWLSPG